MDPSEYRTVQSGVPPFWIAKYARDAPKNWDKFYKRNTTHFFRDRHWTTAADTDGFPCLTNPSSSRTVLVEAGCGVANCAFPLLQANPSLFIYAFDFAPSAVRLVREAEEYRCGRCCAFVWDFCERRVESIAREERGGLDEGGADFCTLVFVLSAVPPEKQAEGLRNLYRLLKPGGKLLFRDYATGDMAQKRFAARSRIDENYFVRQDSTLSYFFEEDRLHKMMMGAGFEKEEMRRVNRLVRNRKEKLEMQRVFLQAVYIKPELST